MQKEEKTKEKEEEWPEELKNLPPEVQKKLKEIKEKIEKFQKKVVDKFDKYIMGIALLPPDRPKEGEKQSEKINVLVLIDDSDSQKLTKEELKEKLTTIINNIAKEIDSNIAPQTIILSELWQDCYDAKYDTLQLIAMSAPVFDRGMLAAIKISEIHKSMILKKFEKYIVSYVLAGSLVQGKATPESDIDVFVVIDDTDVKRMTRAELKDKLRAIIIGMAIEAGEMTGIKNKLNIQVYILTDFWDSIKEANPVIFTFLRDGVPFYDRGVFMPWKLLLKMGKVRPSMEAIEMYMGSGEQMLQRVHEKFNEIGTEDIFYAILTPSQAALMLYGLPPSTPKETPDLMRDIFVKKEKMLTDADVDILERTIKIRKDVEHGTKKEISGEELDKLLKDAEKYLERLKKLYDEIEKRRQQENILNIYESCITIVRDALIAEGIEKVKETEVVPLFKTELVNTGKIPERFARILNNIVKAKKDYDNNKLSKAEIDKVMKDSREFFRFLVEHIQRKRAKELERTKLRIKHGDKIGEVTLLEDTAFIIYDINAEEKEVTKAKLKGDGSLDQIEKSSLEELEETLSKIGIVKRVSIKQPIFDDLRKIFGKDMEVLVNY